MRRPTHRWHLTLLGGLGLSVGCARLDTLWSNATLRDGAVDPDAGPNVAVREPVDPRPLASDDAGGPAITPDPVHDPDLADAAMPADVVTASNPDAATDASVTGDGAVTADGAAVDTRPTLTALASRTGIVEAPTAGAHWIGYVRVGGRIPIVRGPVGNDGCPARRDVQGSGWYEVEGGGYVCIGNLAVLTETLVNRPMSRRLPVTPDLTADMPFQYARNYRAAVMYRWLPSIEDEREVEPERFAPRERPAPPPPSVDGDASVEPAAPSTTPAATDAGAATPDTGVRIEDLVGDPSSPLLRRMTPRMYVSLNRQVVSRNGSAFWHTQSGGYVRSSAMSVVSDAPTFHGVRLDATHHLPMAFALSPTTNTYQSGARGAYTVVSRAPRLTVFQLADENPITAGGNQYYRTVEGFFVNSRQVRTVTRHDAPDDLAPGEKWVDVNLSHQSLVAYEGQTPVYVTVMSSGRRNRSSTENYETVQGAFRIESKHVATTMDGNTANDGPYSIEDVPWVMYFEGSFALHGAFWHNGFGMVHSHGCVNLSPPDARFMFGWTEPQVPTGWHAVYASPAHPGTRVYVHYDEQPLGTRGGPSRVPQH